jgi:hypothetical protein
MRCTYKRLFTILILQLFVVVGYGQKVSNITAEQIGQTIKISYTLVSESECDISLYYSLDNGSRWIGPLKRVSGDIGINILHGSKAIIWDVVDEVVNLVGSEIKFKIIAESTSIQKSNEASYNWSSTAESDNQSIKRNLVPGKFPQGSTRYLNAEDVLKLSKYELKIMRNEIFARHGYIFKTEEMKQYFQNQLWYKPRYSDVNDFLSKIEKVNISLIKDYE